MLMPFSPTKCVSPPTLLEPITVWPDLAKFRHLGIFFKIFGENDSYFFHSKIRFTQWPKFWPRLTWKATISSVTRFGEISSLWQSFKSLWLFFEGVFCIGQNSKTNWASFYDIGQICIVVNGPKLKR